jgi:hypothetical protein
MTSNSVPGMISTPEKTTTTISCALNGVEGSSSPVEIPAVGAVASGSTASTASADDGSQTSSDDDGGAEAAHYAAATEDQDLSSLDFSGSFHELDFHSFHRIMWMVILAIGGFLDIAASMSPIFRTYGGCADRLVTSASAGIGHTQSRGVPLLLDGRIHGMSFCLDVWTPFVLWLEKHHVIISFVFSLLWFRLAFWKAKELHNAAIVTKDRSCLLAEDNAEANEKKKSSTKTVNPQVIYCRRILIEMALLPVGFYIILYHFAKCFISDGKPLSEFFMEIPDEMQEVVVLTITDQEYGIEHEVFTEQSKISLLGAAILHFCRTTLAATIYVRAEIMEYITKSAIPTLIRRLLRNAFRNPMKFNRQLRSALVYLRWIKYMAPL